MDYKKEINKPFKGMGGPRDQQRRQNTISVNNSELIEELRRQISELKSELSKPKEHFTGEQVDEEINKAVQSAIKEVSIKNIELSSVIENKDLQIMELNKQISDKDKLIEKISIEKNNSELLSIIKEQTEQMKQIQEMVKSGNFINTGVSVEDDRPTITDIVIDPTSNTKLESHMDVKGVEFEQKVNIDNKIDKLKNLLGKLPSQIGGKV